MSKIKFKDESGQLLQSSILQTATYYILHSVSHQQLGSKDTVRDHKTKETYVVEGAPETVLGIAR
jgi:hypothetical protein